MRRVDCQQRLQPAKVAMNNPANIRSISRAGALMRFLVAVTLVVIGISFAQEAGALTRSIECRWKNDDDTYTYVINYSAVGTESFPIPSQNSITPGGDGNGNVGQFVITVPGSAGFQWDLGGQPFSGRSVKWCAQQPLSSTGSVELNAASVGMLAVGAVVVGGVAGRVVRRRATTEG
jgi:hypothetical protein